MAEAQKTPDDKDAKPKSKKKLIVIGSAVAAIALGGILALTAVPHAKEEHVPELAGPFVAKLSNEDIMVNLNGEGSKRYLLLSLKAEYFAYDEAYVTARLGAPGAKAGAVDPLYTAALKDAILDVAATKSRDQVTDPVQIEAFLEQLRRAIDPVLFPVCVGDSRLPGTGDLKSGLKIGESAARSTMRGLLHEHELELDAKERTARLDDGPKVNFTKHDRDLRLENREGECVYVDVTGVNKDFVGKLPVGVPGKVRRLYREQFLVQ